jgi:hypothetical protein
MGFFGFAIKISVLFLTASLPRLLDYCLFASPTQEPFIGAFRAARMQREQKETSKSSECLSRGFLSIFRLCEISHVS